MASDKKTIGITKSNAPVLLEIMRVGRFNSELDAAKFALAFAVKKGASAGSTDGAETKWNVGSVDPDGSLRALIETLYPDATEPYRLVEHLMNEGIKSLTPKDSTPIDIYDILFPRE